MLTIEPFDVIRTHGETKLREHSRLLAARVGQQEHRQLSHEARELAGVATVVEQPAKRADHRQDLLVLS